MDKETLSNYGWIVICVLVLAVMIALAGPFGKFVADAVKSTTQGLFDVNQEALGSADIEIDDIGFNYAPVFADNTWEEIAEACQNNDVPLTWNVGDTKTMTINGKEIQVMIIGKNHDTYADGSGIAPLTFQTGIVDSKVMNSSNTNVGGWAGTELYSYINGTLFDTMEYKNFVKPVVKYTNKGYVDSGNQSATEVVASNDKLFILSRMEVFGVDPTALLNEEGSQYAYYASENSSLVNYDGPDGNVGWLRTPHPFNPTYYLCVYKNRADSYQAGSPTGISVGFCF